ncbi:leucine-rich repeat neuronal protein 1-like [Artemia franciscana]|uniref:Uncharacterized protein n=1 Tax=Artemia franciscana TaxID=6661 RepID=A0AA88KZ34_ARTSF|nr:hypothetical protein QYM36_013719 [Artemia franciscana]KAK2710142.1 hypothetical protein QYM36_013719 [Artemia franciscana]
MKPEYRFSDALVSAQLIFIFIFQTTEGCYRDCTCQVEGSTLSLECSRYAPPSVLSMITTKYTDVTLFNVDIRTLDFGLLHQINHLTNFTMRKSSLSKFKGTGRKFLSLESLDLSDNQISILEDHAFRDFPKLIVLILSGNKIHSVSAVALSLKHLQALDLSRNNIRLLHTFALSGMPHLKWVNVSENVMTNIPNGLFGALHTIETVDFSANKITKVADKAIEGINITRVLNLKKNYLKVFPTKAMQHAYFINELIIDENEIVTLEPHSVSKMPLRILEMKNMPTLKSMKQECFSNVPILTGIRVSGCSDFKNIHHKAFLNLSSLVALDLSNNALEIFPQNLVLSIPSLADIDISGNNFICHCSMYWTLSSKLITERITCSENETLVSFSSTNHTDCPPLVIPWSDKVSIVPIGNDITLSCEGISSHPSGVRIVWKGPMGQSVNECARARVPSSPCNEGNELAIHFASEKNNGIYTCYASDENNRTNSYSFSLRVQQGAVKLYATKIASNSISVSWNPPHFSSKFENGFIIEIVDVYSGLSIRNRSFERSYNSHFCKLNGLAANKLYKVNLVVYEEEEYQVLSSINVRTLNNTQDDGIQGIRNGQLLFIIASGFLAIAMIITAGCFARIFRVHIKRKSEALRESKSVNSNIYLVQDDKLISNVLQSQSFEKLCDQHYTEIDISDEETSPLVI